MRFFLMVFSLMLVAPLARAAEFKSFTAKDGRVLISIAGELAEGDTEQFRLAVKAANAANKFVANIRLNSIGGNLLEGVKLAEAVQFAKIATNVGKDGTCASACFLVFAAGETKFANYTARIGVHGASTPAGAEAGNGTVIMARVAKELGVPPAIIGRMVVTPPSEMVWLSPQDLQSMGTSMVGKPDQLAGPPVISPQQTRPGEPLNLNQTTTASAPAKTDWSTLVENVMDLSARQNGGQARTVRNCQPELKVCNTAVFFKTESGTDAALLRREDIKGNTVEKEICTFNSYGDTRWCFDYVKNTKHRDMKDSKGNWSKVADE